MSGNFGPAARVDGQEISADRFEHYFEDFLADRGRNIASIRNPEALRKLRSEAMDAMLDEELLIQEAVRLGIKARPEAVDEAVERMRGNFKTADAFTRRLAAGGFDEAGYRDHIARQLAVKRLVDERIRKAVRISEGEVRGFQRTHPERFVIPEQRRLRHIGLAESPDKTDACAAILPMLKDRSADFAALAKRYSESPGAEHGGDLGWVSRGQLPPFLEQAAFSLAPGQTSGVIRGEGGCHILKCEGRRQGSLPAAEAREAAREHLVGEKLPQAVREHVQGLRRRAKIEILTPL